MPGRPEESIYRFLDTNGDGSGTKNANGDYSVTPDEFYFEAPRHCYLHRIIIHITDTTGIQAQDYGNITSGLTNGYVIKVQDDSQVDVKDICDGVAIKTNADFGRMSYDVDLKSWGAGNETIQCRLTFAKAGYPIELEAGFRLSITLNDDCSGLLEHYFMVQGYEQG